MKRRRTFFHTLGLLGVVALAVFLSTKVSGGVVFPAAETLLLGLGIWFLA